jgi:G6PDH family F420-dependent oxidoreductase
VTTVVEFGYALSSEENTPDDIVDYAVTAEAEGMDFLMVSDHFHPWLDVQGHSPFVWNMLGAIARETNRIQMGTGVTCPTIRIHPAIVAQAAATTARMSDDRFFLGVGTGERLNEHITGERWPPFSERLSMLSEAITVMRELWTGEMGSHYGDHFTVEQAKLYTLPEGDIDVAVAAAGPESATLAGEKGDALVNTAPSEAPVAAFEAAHEDGGPRYGQAAVCYAETERAGRQTVHEQWSNGGLPGQLGQELPTPDLFEQAGQLVTEEDAAGDLACGPDPDEFIKSIQEYLDAGYDHIYLHQIGQEQTEFLEFFAEEVAPSFD